MAKFNCSVHGTVDSFKSVALAAAFCPKCCEEVSTPEHTEMVRRSDSLLARTDKTLAYTNKVLDLLER